MCHFMWKQTTAWICAHNNGLWSSVIEMCSVTAAPFYTNTHTHTHISGVAAASLTATQLIAHLHNAEGTNTVQERRCQTHETRHVGQEWRVKGVVLSNSTSTDNRLLGHGLKCSILYQETAHWIDHWQYGAISDISINANDLILRDSKRKHCCTVCTQKISPTKTQPRPQSLFTKFFWALPKMHHGGLFLLVWHYCHLLARSVSLRELNHLIQVWSVRWWSLNMGGMQNTRS